MIRSWGEFKFKINILLLEKYVFFKLKKFPHLLLISMAFVL